MNSLQFIWQKRLKTFSSLILLRLIPNKLTTTNKRLITLIRTRTLTDRRTGETGVHLYVPTNILCGLCGFACDLLPLHCVIDDVHAK